MPVYFCDAFPGEEFRKKIYDELTLQKFIESFEMGGLLGWE